MSYFYFFCMGNLSPFPYLSNYSIMFCGQHGSMNIYFIYIHREMFTGSRSRMIKQDKEGNISGTLSTMYVCLEEYSHYYGYIDLP